MKRSIKTYNGGKAGAGTYQTIISQIPKCEIFIDAMAGSLGITSKMSLPALTVINDIDKNIYEMSLLPAVVRRSWTFYDNSTVPLLLIINKIAHKSAHHWAYAHIQQVPDYRKTARPVKTLLYLDLKQ